MRVQDVMTTDVATVRPDTPLRDVARTFVERRISAMPVVDADGRVVGVISETDLLAKERWEPRERRGMLARLPGRAARDRRRRKHDARVASEAMTAPAITIERFWPLSVAARQMLDASVNHLPVVKHGELIGIVARADLMRALVRSDEEIACEVRERIALMGGTWLEGAHVEARVSDGEATLSGTVRGRNDAESLLEVVEKVPGVIGVRSEVTWETPGGGKSRTGTGQRPDAAPPTVQQTRRR